MALQFSLLAATASIARSQVSYYTFYQDPFCTANGNACTGPGCCDERLDGKTLMNPVNWPNCSTDVVMESVLINPVAPNMYGGIDMDFIGRYYAKGAYFFDAQGNKVDWSLNETVIECGGESHDKPYSYGLPLDAPVPHPLCIPAAPPTRIQEAIDALNARGIRAGISLLGGGGGDNPPPTLRGRNRLENLMQLDEDAFTFFEGQLAAAGAVMHGWGITHFDLDFEGGLTQTLNCDRLRRVLAALSFPDALTSVTTEQGYLAQMDCLTTIPENRPDMIQLMMSNYYSPWSSGISQIQSVSNQTGYPVSQFRLGIKPQCGVSTGELSYLTGALPELVDSGARPMLWNLPRDYPCQGSCGSGECMADSLAGQQPFTAQEPFAWTCAISEAYFAPRSVVV